LIFFKKEVDSYFLDYVIFIIKKVVINGIINKKNKR